jgi:hypothetical protein
VFLILITAPAEDLLVVLVLLLRSPPPTDTQTLLCWWVLLLLGLFGPGGCPPFTSGRIRTKTLMFSSCIFRDDTQAQFPIDNATQVLRKRHSFSRIEAMLAIEVNGQKIAKRLMIKRFTMLYGV